MKCTRIAGKKQLQVKKAKLNAPLSASLSPPSITSSHPPINRHQLTPICKAFEAWTPSARPKRVTNPEKWLDGLCWPEDGRREPHGP